MKSGIKVVFQLILGSYLMLLMHDFIPHSHPQNQGSKALQEKNHHHHHHDSDHQHPEGNDEDTGKSENLNFFQLILHQQSVDEYHSHPLYYLTNALKVIKIANHFTSVADHPDGKPPPIIPKQKFSKLSNFLLDSEFKTGNPPLRAPPALS